MKKRKGLLLVFSIFFLLFLISFASAADLQIVDCSNDDTDPDNAGLGAICKAANYNGNHVITNDIECSGTWAPICRGPSYLMDAFEGTINGNYHTISGIDIDLSTNMNYLGGLVGILNGGTIKNLNLDLVKINGLTSVGGGTRWVGGLVGQMQSGTIERVSITGGEIDAGDNNIGGLVGEQIAGTITRSFATVNVKGSWSGHGGLVGRQTGGAISNSFAIGNVEGNDEIGGLVGRSYGTITRSFARGDATGTVDRVGGLVGRMSGGAITSSYATGRASASSDYGGFLGVLDSGTINNCYRHSNLGNDYGILEESYTDFFQSSHSVYTIGPQWDFTNIWIIKLGSGYPYLKFQENNCNDGTCQIYEDCLNCLQDCGCGNGYECIEGSCEVETNCVASYHYDITPFVDICSAYFSPFLCKYASDGSVASTNRWVAPDKIPPHWVYGDLGTKKCIKKVRVRLDNGFTPQTMDVQVSEDGYHWKSIEKGWIIATPLTFIEKIFSSEVSGRFVRFWITGCGGSRCEIDDFEVNARFTTIPDYIFTQCSDLSTLCSANRKYSTIHLGNNIDCSGVSYTIPCQTDTFKGSLDGNGFNITGLSITSSASNYIGLIGRNDGALLNISLEIEINSNKDYVGGLVGYNYAQGHIENANIKPIQGGSGINGANYIGGLVGQNEGKIFYSSANVDITATGDYVGGAVGYSSDNLFNVFVSGDVSATQDYVGGLIGESDDKIVNCSANGYVSGRDYVGGLVGKPNANIDKSAAFGDVSGRNYVGGFFGYQDSEGDGNVIENSYAKGNIVCNSKCGGFGSVQRSRISNCYARGNIEGIESGGFVYDSQANEIKNCFTVSNIIGEGRGFYYLNTGGSIVNSYYTGTAGHPTLPGEPIKENNKDSFKYKNHNVYDSNIPFWNFISPWGIIEGETYPYLVYIGVCGDTICTFDENCEICPSDCGCSVGMPYCFNGECVECTSSAQCSEGWICQDNQCTEIIAGDLEWQDMMKNPISTADLGDTVLVYYESGSASEYFEIKQDSSVLKELREVFTMGADLVAKFILIYGDLDGDTGPWSLTASSIGGTEKDSGVLDIVEDSYDNYPPTSTLVSPVADNTYVISNGKTGQINFDNTISDIDDDLKVSWDYGDEDVDNLNNCLTTEDCDETHSYSESGTKTVILTTSEMEPVRAQKKISCSRIEVYEEGYNVFSIIDTPVCGNPLTGIGYHDIEGGSSHVDKCFDNKPDCDTELGGSCNTITDALDSNLKLYCYEFAGSSTLTFRWSFDRVVDDVHRTNVPFKHFFITPDEHTVDLRVIADLP